MTEFAFTPPAQPSVAIHGRKDRFPVRRIFCVGRNYAEHSREMGNDPDKEPPFFFTKPADAIVPDGATIPYPTRTSNVHHEAELVIAIAKGGANITPDVANAHIFGFACGNDLTRRDLQAEAKAGRRPWDMAKGFDQSAVIGALHTGDLAMSARLTAHVDGALKQDSTLDQMIWDVPNIIAYLSTLVTLAPGDLVMTGTPAGVGPIEKGQTCVVEIEGLSQAGVTLT